LKRSFSILLSALLLFAAGSFADERKDRQAEQPASSFYELRDHAVVRVGDKIFLTDSEGDVIEGKIASLAWEDATLTLENAFKKRESTLGARTFSEADIRRIEVEMNDSLANGALIGAAAGAGVILVPIAFAGGGNEYIGGYEAWFLGAAIVAGAGAAIGAGIDAIIKERRLIFDATEHRSAWSLRVVPILSKHRKAVAISLSF
jgi:hypothetical protein